MKKSQDIEVLRLSALLQSVQSQLAFLREKAENSVSREEYDAVVAERDALKAESLAMDTIHAEEIAAMKAAHKAELAGVEKQHQAELADKDRQLKEFEEINALLPNRIVLPKQGENASAA